MNSICVKLLCDTIFSEGVNVVEQGTSNNDVMIVFLICATVVILALIVAITLCILRLKKPHVHDCEKDNITNKSEVKISSEFEKTDNAEEKARKRFEEFCYRQAESASNSDEVAKECWKYLKDNYSQKKATKG